MEFIRRFIQKFIKTNSKLYFALADIIEFINIVFRCGFKTYILLAKAKRKREFKKEPFWLNFTFLHHPILIRPGTDDATTIINNIIREEWGQIENNFNPEWIIDAGAYIGDTSAYFLSKFPNVNIIALEPNPETFTIMSQNLKPYEPRITMINSGLYSKDCQLFFEGAGTSASVNEKGKTEIEVITINSLLKRFNLNHISILKIDIEGSEEQVFASKPEEWLKLFDCILIEFHSEYGKTFILDILKSNGFKIKQYRSVWYCNRMNNQVK
jgi:FkbM family methyltransferase